MRLPLSLSTDKSPLFVLGMEMHVCAHTRAIHNNNQCSLSVAAWWQDDADGAPQCGAVGVLRQYWGLVFSCS